MPLPAGQGPEPRGRERGATVFEFALILPIFVLLVFGLIELGHAWYISHAITTASREGARHGIRFRNVPGSNPAVRWPPKQWNGPAGSDTQSIESKVKEFLKMFFDETYVDNQVTVTIPNNPQNENEDLTVTVTAPKPWFILGPLIGIGDTNISATTTMKLE